MIGVDEVGRGCLAGPLLVVAARQKAALPDGLTDSKLLTPKKRADLYKLLIISCEFGDGWVTSLEINKRGLAGAMRLGVRRALQKLGADYDEDIVMDGPVNYTPKAYRNVRCLIDADASVAVVSAASVYAKVKRDRYMVELARKHRRYGFEKHVGYGTTQHLEALRKYGALKTVHRMYFEPVAAMNNLQLWPNSVE